MRFVDTHHKTHARHNTTVWEIGDIICMITSVGIGTRDNLADTINIHNQYGIQIVIVPINHYFSHKQYQYRIDI